MYNIGIIGIASADTFDQSKHMNSKLYNSILIKASEIIQNTFRLNWLQV